jgi:phosphocarrier protein
VSGENGENGGTTDGAVEMRVERSVEVRNRHGLHARPAAEFVRLASRFDAEVQVSKDDLEVNGKSIMGVLMLAAEPGAVLTIQADGVDAEQAVAALVEYLHTDEGLEGMDLPGDDA